MKYAVIQTGGKQYRVSEGSQINVESLHLLADKPVSFSDVLLYVSDNAEVKVGKPYVDGIVVKGKVIGEKKGQKIRVARFLAKSRYRRVHGHRQILSNIKIEQILDKPAEKSKEENATEMKSNMRSTSKPRKKNVK